MNILHKPFFKKILYSFAGIFILLLILNYIFFPWYVSADEVNVPKVLGIESSQAIVMLEDAGLTPMIGGTYYDERFPKGSVIVQKPEAGALVKEGRRIYLFISGGEPEVRVPRLKGRSLRDAKTTLTTLGLKVGTVEEVPSATPKDVIVGQQYPEGTMLKKGSYVGLSISIGPLGGNIEVPDLIGKSLSEAERILAMKMLKVGKKNYQPSFSLLPNTILDQYPSKGSRLNEGDAVDLFITTDIQVFEETEIRDE